MRSRIRTTRTNRLSAASGDGTISALRTRDRGGHDSARRREGQMRRTTPDLVGRRKKVFDRISVGLLVLTVLYVLWTNYVVFVGGNLPLTSISLGQGSTGAGFVMLPVGALLFTLVIWFVLDGIILNLLHAFLLATSHPRRTRPGAPRGRGKKAAAQRSAASSAVGSTPGVAPTQTFPSVQGSAPTAGPGPAQGSASTQGSASDEGSAPVSWSPPANPIRH